MGDSVADPRMPTDADTEAWDPGPIVCPGCHAVGDEPCAPGCIDDETVLAREEEDDREDDREGDRVCHICGQPTDLCSCEDCPW